MLLKASNEEKVLVDAAVRDMESLYLESNRKMHQLRKIRYMKLRPSAPKPFQRVISGGLRSPLSYRLVQTVVGMICKERPVYKRIPLNNDDRDSASRLQASADPLMQDLERIARRPLYQHFVDAMVGDGRAAMKCYHDVWNGFPDQLEGEPHAEYNRRVADFVMRGANHPLRMRMVDALNFQVPLTAYEPPYVVERGKRPTLAVMSAFGLKFGTNNKLMAMPDQTAFNMFELPSGIPTTMDVEEVWTPETAYVRIQGQVFKTPNDLGFLPYVWATGETSSHPDPSLSSLSILYPMAGLEPWLNTMLTVLASWGVIGGTPILYTSRKLPPGAGGVPDVQPQLSDIPLGKRIDLGIGGEIGFVTPPPVGREVLEFIQFLTDFMDRAGLPGMAYGEIGSRTPGTAFQGALEQAISKINPIVQSAERAMAELIQVQWKIIEHIGKPMYVTGLGVQPGSIFKRKQLGRFSIDPKDIQGYYDLHAKIKVGSTQDAVTRGMHAAFMRDKKLWSRDRAMEYADVDNPFQEYKDIMRDTLEESPLIQQLTLQSALEHEPEFAQRASALAQQGVDVGALLTGQPQPTTVGVAPGGASGGIPGPAPRRGGRPTGMPKNPGGNRGRPPGGSRGHS